MRPHTIHTAAGLLLTAALSWGFVRAEGSARPPFESILPPHFGFGVSCFGSNGAWPERAKRELGAQWDFAYVYVFPRTEESYVAWFLGKAEKMQARPILSFYGLLELGRAAGYGGSEIDIVLRVLKDPEAMRKYLESAKRLLQQCAKSKAPVIFHAEPDSWAFMEWHGTEETHDASRCPAMVKSTGMPEVQDFPDHAGGLGQALIHLRDLYAPQVYMGFHCKDCRVGTSPELTVKFVRGCGTWDVLLGDGIGHVYKTRDAGWWDAFDEALYKRYMNWYGTVTRELGLKYIHWQSVIGKADYTLLPDYPSRERVRDYMRAGAVAVLFDLRGDPDNGGGRSDGNHGYSASPPPGHPAENTPQALCRRLAAYYKQPIPLAGLGRAAEQAAASAKPEPTPAIATPRPEPSKPKLDPAATGAWDERLRARLNAAQKSGKPVLAYLRLFGPSDASKRYRILGASGGSLHVQVEGNRMPMKWSELAPEDRANLAKGVLEAGADDAPALALAAVYLYASERVDEAEQLLAKASKSAPEAVREARLALGLDSAGP
ncbi:MAG: hypothetical protein M5U26_13330 [Planctomycetota bacterium]|nr:hypothetical protein [Planctomycetota bacterium]